MSNRSRIAALSLVLVQCIAGCDSSSSGEMQPAVQAGNGGASGVGGGTGGASGQGGGQAAGNGGAGAGSGAGGIGGGAGAAGSAGMIAPTTGGTGGGSGMGGDAGPTDGCGDGMCATDETCRTCGDDCGACNDAPFGTTDIHPERVGIYMIPDLPGDYTSDWEKTKRTLNKIHQIVPDAWIRWDNETGHVTDTPQNVEAFVSAAHDAGIPMIITASAVDGYNNWWANGNKQPTVSITQIADGPYLEHADMLLRTYPNVRLVETINEPDTMWFVADPDNTDSWNYYMTKLYAAMDNDYAHILGPSVAFKGSQIWNNHAARSELTNFSYHTYSGYQSLEEVGDKDVYVTEYGLSLLEEDIPLTRSAGGNLADLWRAEKAGKLSGRIKMIFYVMLQDMTFWGQASEGDHFTLSSHLRGMSIYAALGSFGKRAYLEDANPDFMATDDRHGGFAAAIWNESKTETKNTGTRVVPATSVATDAPLYVLRVWYRSLTDVIDNGGTSVECQPLASQSWVDASIAADSVTLTIKNIGPLDAVLISTKPCTDLAN